MRANGDGADARRQRPLRFAATRLARAIEVKGARRFQSTTDARPQTRRRVSMISFVQCFHLSFSRSIPSRATRRHSTRCPKGLDAPVAHHRVSLLLSHTHTHGCVSLGEKVCVNDAARLATLQSARCGIVRARASARFAQFAPLPPPPTKCTTLRAAICVRLLFLFHYNYDYDHYCEPLLGSHAAVHLSQRGVRLIDRRATARRSNTRLCDDDFALRPATLALLWTLCDALWRPT